MQCWAPICDNYWRGGNRGWSPLQWLSFRALIIKRSRLIRQPVKEDKKDFFAYQVRPRLCNFHTSKRIFYNNWPRPLCVIDFFNWVPSAMALACLLKLLHPLCASWWVFLAYYSNNFFFIFLTNYNLSQVKKFSIKKTLFGLFRGRDTPGHK